MTQQKSFRDRLPFPVASIMLILYLTFLGAEYLMFGTPIHIYEIIECFLLLSLAILMMVKFPNAGITISLGLYLLFCTYVFFIQLLNGVYFYMLGEVYGIIEIICRMLPLIGLLCLTLQSISTYTNLKLSFLNAIWFLPSLFSFTRYTLWLIQFFGNIRYIDVEDIFISLPIQLFYCLFVLLAGKWLADVSRIKHPDPNRPNETVYNFRAPQPNYVQPPVSPYAPQPPMPPVPPMPRVPVAPFGAPAPQAPFVPPIAAPAPQSAAQDPVEELKRYKDLLDDGIITQEEYDAKKKQILNL